MRKKKLKKISEEFWNNYFEKNEPIIENFTEEDADARMD